MGLPMLMSFHCSLHIFKSVRGATREPEVGNFRYAVLEEDVRDFDVTVDDVLLGQVTQSLIDLVDELARLRLMHGSLGPHLGFHVTAIAQLGDDVAVVGAREDLHAV